ncbi:MAG: hypothetical protein FWC89_00435 [Defluviitaleaceae bacterium]|nr:hypothetical protein [Defluviitaleaceae bacterium]
MKKLILGTMAAIILAGTTTTVFANTTPSTASNYQYAQRQLNIVNHGIVTPPNENSISRDEAAQIGADALENFFGADLDGITIGMFYLERVNAYSNTGNAHNIAHAPRAIEIPAIPSTWTGFIMPSDDALFSKFDFIINAETGELISARFYPSAAESVSAETQSGRVVDFGGFVGFAPNAQHNIGYSRLAMNTVQELNILEGEAEKARLLTHMLGSDVFGVPIITFLVEVQCVDGKAVVLGFDGFLHNEPVLTSVEREFNLPRAWRTQQFDWVAAVA